MLFRSIIDKKNDVVTLRNLGANDKQITRVFLFEGRMIAVIGALIAYIIFEGPAEDRNMNTLVDMISGMEVKEDDEDFMNAVDYMFAGLEKRKPDCFAVKQYKKYKLASGDVCSK